MVESIAIRDYNSVTDEAFVIDSWMHSFYGAPYTTYISPKEYKRQHIPLIAALLAKSKVRLAINKEDPDIIIAYVVFEPNLLHYLYVKESFRGFGIAKQLLSECQFSENSRATHLTVRGKKILRRLGLIYSPYF